MNINLVEKDKRSTSRFFSGESNRLGVTSHRSEAVPCFFNASSQPDDDHQSDASNTTFSLLEPGSVSQLQVEQGVSKKGWEAIASLFWERFPKPPSGNPTTFADGITNLLGIEPLNEARITDKLNSFQQNRLNPSRKESKRAEKNQGHRFKERDKTNTLLSQSNNLVMTSEDYQQCIKSYTEEIHDLKTLLKANQKAFADEINSLQMRQRQLENEQNDLLKRLAVINQEREEQEFVLSSHSLDLSQATRQVILLKSQLLHYKNLFRRFSYSSFVPRNTPVLTPHIHQTFEPFNATQFFENGIKASVLIDFATSSKGSLYLILSREGQENSLEYSQVQHLELIPLDDTCHAKLQVFSLSHGLLLFLIENEKELEKCLRLFLPMSAVNCREDNAVKPKSKNENTSLFQYLQQYFSGRQSSPCPPRVASRATNTCGKNLLSLHESSSSFKISADVSHSPSSYSCSVPYKKKSSEAKDLLQQFDYPFKSHIYSQHVGYSDSRCFSSNQRPENFGTASCDRNLTVAYSSNFEDNKCYSSPTSLYNQENRKDLVKTNLNQISSSCRLKNLSKRKTPTIQKALNSPKYILANTRCMADSENQEWLIKRPFHILEQELKKNTDHFNSDSTFSAVSSQSLVDCYEKAQKNNSTEDQDTVLTSWSTCSLSSSDHSFLFTSSRQHSSAIRKQKYPLCSRKSPTTICAHTKFNVNRSTKLALHFKKTQANLQIRKKLPVKIGKLRHSINEVRAKRYEKNTHKRFLIEKQTALTLRKDQRGVQKCLESLQHHLLMSHNLHQ